MAERLMLEAMAAVDACLPQWWAACEELREREAFASTGVVGAYGGIVPVGSLRDATASVYAEIAHRFGWLQLDRALSEVEFHRMSTDIGGWVTQDRTMSEVIETFGPPSVWIGGTNSLYSKTLAYTVADTDQGLICVHLWNAVADAATETGPQGVHPEPVVLAVRHRPGRFPDSFSFTPRGLRRRPTQDG
ncbi:hypothetical protein [Micromonospora sp. DT229]|uniref:hypothetical protein n=1 Tax=Micromonospora sp. DT229 TaxID=3393430 RepID=UPI003CF0AD1D